MPKDIALQQAIAAAVAELANVDLARRAPLLGLPPATAGHLSVRLLGVDQRLDLATLALTEAATGRPAKPTDHVLLLHCLRHPGPLPESTHSISFRDFPGGQFYYQPFRSRSGDLLEKRHGNHLDPLRRNLDRFDWQPLDLGDLGARIHAFGRLFVDLIYRAGDDELPAAADLLFSDNCRLVFNADDAATLATRICVALL